MVKVASVFGEWLTNGAEQSAAKRRVGGDPVSSVVIITQLLSILSQSHRRILVSKINGWIYCQFFQWPTPLTDWLNNRGTFGFVTKVAEPWQSLIIVCDNWWRLRIQHWVIVGIGVQPSWYFEYRVQSRGRAKGKTKKIKRGQLCDKKKRKEYPCSNTQSKEKDDWWYRCEKEIDLPEWDREIDGR